MGRVPPQEQVGRHWSHPRNQECVGVWPADGGAQGQVGHNWAVERAMAVQPLGAREADVQREKGGSALLTLPKALGLMALAGRGRDMIILGLQRKMLCIWI